MIQLALTGECQLLKYIISTYVMMRKIDRMPTINPLSA